MKRYQANLAAFLLTPSIVTPGAAQQMLCTVEISSNGECAGCFAHLEYPPMPETAAFSSRTGEDQQVQLPPVQERDVLLTQRTIRSAIQE